MGADGTITKVIVKYSVLIGTNQQHLQNYARLQFKDTDNHSNISHTHYLPYPPHPSSLKNTLPFYHPLPGQDPIDPDSSSKRHLIAVIASFHMTMFFCFCFFLPDAFEPPSVPC